MKRKKFLTLLAVSALAVSLLAGCGSKEPAGPSKSTEEMYDTLLAANPIDNPFEIGDINLELDFGLAKEDVVEYKGVMSNDNDNAGLVLVVKAASGKADTVKAALETYQQNQVAYFGNYAEFADAQSAVENGVLRTSGDYVVLVFASNESGLVNANDGAVSEALS